MPYSPNGVLTLRWAEESHAHAREFGLTVPAAVTKAERARAALHDVEHAPPPARPPLPADPSGITDAITEHATARHTRDTSSRIAGEYATDAGARYMREVAAAVPNWITALSKVHEEALDSLTAVVMRLPDTVDDTSLGRLTVTQFRHWQTATTATHTLERVIAARTAMDKAATQPAAGIFGHLALTAELGAPQDGTDVRGAWQWVSWAHKQWRNHATLTGTVPRWRALVEATQHVPELALSLAPHGDVRARALATEAWRDRAVNAPLRMATYYTQ